MSLDEEFHKKLLETFKIEAEEHLQALSFELLNLEQNSGNISVEVLEKIFREAHSLKGSARAVDLKTIQGLCQSFENILSATKKGNITLTPPIFTLLSSVIALLKKLIQKCEEAPTNKENEEIDLLISAMESAAAGNASTAEIPNVETSKQEEKSEATQKNEIKPQEDLKTKSVRISTEKLDTLLRKSEEMLMVKLSTRQRSDDLKNILIFLKKHTESHSIEAELKWIQGLIKNHQMEEAGKAMLHFLPQLQAYFDLQQNYSQLIEQNLTSIAHETSNDFRLFGSMVDTVFEEIKKLLMQPLFTILEPFPRMIRDIASTLNKEIHFEMKESQVEVDRRVLEQLKDPLMHLIRNSIDHGIESSEERIKLGKTKEGKIWLKARQTGNAVEITVEDDGRGIQIEKIKQAALKHHLFSEDTLNQMSAKEVEKIIFQGGISTSPIITEISGRGIGLGVVSEKVEKLGGVLNLESEEGKFTKFILTIPISLTAFRGIYIKVDEQQFILPTLNVLKVTRIPSSEVKTIEMRETILFNDEPISLVRFKNLLGKTEKETNKPFLTVIVIHALHTLAALEVDEIIGEDEVFVKHFGNQLKRLKHLSSATMAESGTIIPILDPFDLIKSISQQKFIVKTKELSKEEKTKRILIAEDALTARILLKNILETAGFEVDVAVNGEEAWNLLQKERFDLLVSDVDMPKMNGFALTKKIREEDTLQHLPVILCTSLGSKEDREKGIQVGANAYIDKSSFAQNNLLDIVQRLI